jgi:hypothetical protein
VFSPHELEEMKALFICSGDPGVNHAGSIGTQLRDGESFCMKRNARLMSESFSDAEMLRILRSATPH